MRNPVVRLAIKGELKGNGFSFSMSDTQKYGQAIGHLGKLVSRLLKVGEGVQANVDESAPRTHLSEPLNAHLMHAAPRGF